MVEEREAQGQRAGQAEIKMKAVARRALEDLPQEEKATLAANIQFARNLEAQVFTVKGKSVAHAAAAFVRDKRITHVVFGRTAVHGLRKYLYYWAIQHFLKEAPNVDVHIVTQHSERE